jgi:hypothetical protein
LPPDLSGGKYIIIYDWLKPRSKKELKPHSYSIQFIIILKIQIVELPPDLSGDNKFMKSN